MKTKMAIFGVTTILSTALASSLLMAQQPEKPKVDVKCFVELYGGGHSIYSAHLAEIEYKTLPATLVNRKVNNAKRDKKIKVYAVKECTLEENEFKNAAANELEKTRAR